MRLGSSELEAKPVTDLKNFSARPLQGCVRGMYGLLFHVLRDLVSKKWGEKTWKKLCQLAKAPSEVKPDQVYDDALILALVSEASKMLSLDASAILEASGITFVEYLKGTL